MNLRTGFLALLGASVLALISSPAQAYGRVIRCDDCGVAEARYKAKANGPGYVYIVDFEKMELKLFDVWEESDRVWVADPLEVPVQMETFFLLTLDGLSKNETVIVTIINAGGPYDRTLFQGDPLGGYAEYNAYQISGNATYQAGPGKQPHSRIAGTPCFGRRG